MTAGAMVSAGPAPNPLTLTLSARNQKTERIEMRELTRKHP